MTANALEFGVRKENCSSAPKGRRQRPSSKIRDGNFLFDQLNPVTKRKLVLAGVVSKVRGRFDVAPEMTCLDLWQDYERRVGLPTEVDEFRSRLKLAITLKVTDAALTDEFLLAYLKVFGEGSKNTRRIQSVIGFCDASAVAQRLHDLTGTRFMGGYSRPHGDVGIMDILDLLPEFCRNTFRTVLEALEPRPDLAKFLKFVARLKRMTEGPHRLLWVLFLIRSLHAGVKPQTLMLYFWLMEKERRIFEGADFTEAADLQDRLERFLTAKAGPDDCPVWACAKSESGQNRIIVVDRHFCVKRMVRRFVFEVAEAFASHILELLPRHYEPSKKTRQEVATKKAEAHQASREARKAKVLPIASNYQATLQQLEMRYLELFSVAQACREEVDRAADALDAGDEYRFSASLPSFGSGLPGAKVHLAMVDERTLLTEADGRQLLKGKAKRRLANLKADQDGGRIFVEYLGMTGGLTGEGMTEPFWVPYFRTGLLQVDGLVRGDIEEQRTKLARAMGLSSSFYPRRDFLGFHKDHTDILVHTLSSGRVLVPMLGFFHAMLIASITIRFSLLAGPRISETCQLRQGGFVKEIREGESHVFAMLIPKGRRTGHRFPIDDVLLARLEQVESLISQRWHAGRTSRGLPYVPVVSFRASPAIRPDARYLFQGKNSALSGHDAALFATLFSHGIMDLDFHDERHVFATAFSQAGAMSHEIGLALNHTDRMSRECHYDASADLSAEEAAAWFNKTGQDRLAVEGVG